MTGTVGVNLLWMVSGDVGGTEEYATRLLAPFASLPEFSLEFFGLRGLPAAHPELLQAGVIHEAPTTGVRRSARVVAERSWLRQRTRDAAFVHHFGGTVPAGLAPPSLLTVHDLLPLDNPSLFSGPKARWLQRQIPASIARAHRVMAPSAYVVDQIIDRFDVDPERVHVVPSSHSGGAQREVGSEASSATMFSALGIRPPFVLYPAISYHHKNHAVLVDAIAALNTDDVQVVFTGRPDAAQPSIDEAIATLGLGERVKVLGRLPSLDFATLFAEATALVFPSRFEGFGLPLIEAMARGVPVIAANATAIPEVVDDAGLLIEPDDADAWAAAIDRIIADEDLRADLIQRGRQRAADFSPMVCAERLAAIYRSTRDELR